MDLYGPRFLIARSNRNRLAFFQEVAEIYFAKYPWNLRDSYEPADDAHDVPWKPPPPLLLTTPTKRKQAKRRGGKKVYVSEIPSDEDPGPWYMEEPDMTDEIGIKAKQDIIDKKKQAS